MIKRIILWPIAGLLLLTLLLSATLAALLYSETGTRWVLERAIPFVPGELSYEEFSGSLYKGFTLQGLRYSNDSMAVHANEIEFKPEWLELMERRITISQLQLHGLHVALMATDKEDEEKDATPPFHPDNLGNIRLPVSAHIYNAELHGFTLTTATGGLVAVEYVKLVANSANNKLTIEHLGVETTEQNLRVRGELSLLQPMRVNAAVNWDTLLPEAAQKLFNGQEQAAGQLNVSGPLAKLELKHMLRTPMAMDTQAKLAAFDTPLAFDVQHTWAPFTLHLPDGQFGTLPVEDGTLTLAGNLDDYAINLTTGTQVALTETAQPELGIDIAASGDLHQLHIAPAAITIGDSLLSLEGKLAWQDNITWQAHLEAKALNPGLVLADYPGDINATLTSTGSFSEEGLRLVADLLSLQGSWLEQPISGAGNMKLATNGAMESKLNLSLGDNHVNATANINDNINAALDINANNLANFMPVLAGTLHSDVKITGKKTAPVVNGTLRGDAIAFNELSIANVRLNANTQGAMEDPQMDLRLQAQGIAKGEQRLLDDAEFNVVGRFSQHQANWALNAGDYQHTANLQGSLKDQQHWSATLQAFNITGPITGRWGLAQTAALQASPQQASLNNFCLQQEGSSVCAQGSWHNTDGSNAKLNIQALPLAVANVFIPDEAATLSGDINAQAHFQQAGKTPAVADFLFTLSAGAVSLDSGDDDPYEIPWRGLEIKGSLDGEKFDTALHFDVADHTGIRGTLKGHLQEAIEGRFLMRMDDLGWLEIVSPEVRDVTGSIGANLTIGGTLQDFTLDGSVNVKDMALQIPMIGVTLRDGNIQAVAKQGQPIVIDGRIHSGKGHLQIDGKVPTTGDFPRPITFTISGKDFQVADIPEAEVFINPRIYAALVGMDLFLRGGVEVPTAHITPKELPTSAVNVSNDQIILDEEFEEKTIMNVDAALQVTLGDSVTVEGFGLNARFGGDLTVYEQPEKPLRVSGQVNIIEGRFKAVGQDLRVENGTVFFQGSPSNPGLDIRAYRDVKAYGVRAGLELGGTLSDPRSRVYSEPDMDETEAMAFLLTGKPLDSGSDTDAAAIMQAIALYGIEKKDFITDRVGDKLGLDVGVDTDGDFEDTALMLGKQLSSRLYLRYSIGLFEALNTVMLSYAVSQHINLETRSNAEEQSVDVIYRTER